MSITVAKEDSGALLIKKEEHLGHIYYEAGRQYPWKANTGCVVQYFATQHEAYEFIVQRNAIT